jgi:O-glycosyl hydrolase
LLRFCTIFVIFLLTSDSFPVRKVARAEGIDFIAITPQNEPGFFSNSYPTCGWTAVQQRDFIRIRLGPVFKERNLSTKI